jgi:hypothetical protein
LGKNGSPTCELPFSVNEGARHRALLRQISLKFAATFPDILLMLPTPNWRPTTPCFNIEDV